MPLGRPFRSNLDANGPTAVTQRLRHRAGVWSLQKSLLEKDVLLLGPCETPLTPGYPQGFQETQETTVLVGDLLCSTQLCRRLFENWWAFLWPVFSGCTHRSAKEQGFAPGVLSPRQGCRPGLSPGITLGRVREEKWLLSPGPCY